MFDKGHASPSLTHPFPVVVSRVKVIHQNGISQEAAKHWEREGWGASEKEQGGWWYKGGLYTFSLNQCQT